MGEFIPIIVVVLRPARSRIRNGGQSWKHLARHACPNRAPLQAASRAAISFLRPPVSRGGFSSDELPNLAGAPHPLFA